MADNALSAIDEFIAAQSADTSGDRWRTRLAQPPQADFDAGSTYFWDLETNVGSLHVQLMPDVAPMHVSSTIYLTRLGFYDGLIFHRVIMGFMAQGGCPLGSGSGGPGYEYAGEFDPSVSATTDPACSAWRTQGPGTDGSQFFLTFVPTPWLDDNHTIFGEVVDGKDTLLQLERGGSQGGETKRALGDHDRGHPRRVAGARPVASSRGGSDSPRSRVARALDDVATLLRGTLRPHL